MLDLCHQRSPDAAVPACLIDPYDMKLTAPAPHGAGCSGDDPSIFAYKNRKLPLVADTSSLNGGLRHVILQESKIPRVRLVLKFDAVRVDHRSGRHAA